MSKRYGLFVLVVVLMAGVILLVLLNSGHLDAPAKPVATQQSQQTRLKHNSKSASTGPAKAAGSSTKPNGPPKSTIPPSHLTNSGPGSTALLFLTATLVGYVGYLSYLKRFTDL